MAELRTLIDYATGENWEMPVELYSRYLVEQLNFSEDGLTVIQQWIGSLTKEERQLIHKR